MGSANAFTLGEDTIASGNELHGFTTLTEKQFLFNFNLDDCVVSFNE